MGDSRCVRCALRTLHHREKPEIFVYLAFVRSQESGVRSQIHCIWQKDPYAGGWHSWSPRCQPWELMKQMRHPIHGANLYVCGQAHSNMQGWVQGALNSAELMLGENFN
jgi:monoamine oxidase